MKALIIGASSGIGREVAHVFSRNGWDVICSARDETELHMLSGDLKTRYGGNAHVAPVDLTDPVSVSRFVRELYVAHPIIDCVVMTAGTLPRDEEEHDGEEDLIRVTATNYIGVALMLNGISRRMAAKNAGVIICMSSVAGERGRRKNFIYGASKSALTTYLQGLRMKMHGHGVRVVTVVPGYVDTLMAYGKVRKGFAVSPQYVARKIYKLLGRNKDVAYIPPIWWLIMKTVKLVPESLFKRLRFNV